MKVEMEEGKIGELNGEDEKMEIAYSGHRPGQVVEKVKPPPTNDGQIEIDLAPKSLGPAETLDEAADTQMEDVDCEIVAEIGDSRKIPDSPDVVIVKSIIEQNVVLPSDKNTSLSVIANYGSDSYDSDDNTDESRVNETVNPAPPVIQPISTPLDFQTEYRKIQPSSDDSESDSSASSEDESSSSSSTESFDGLAAKSKAVAGAAQGKDLNQKVNRTKGDPLMSDLPPIADLQISVAEAACLEMGFVSSIVESQVIVHAKPNVRPLNLETVLFLDKGKRPLGAIFDVFGQVTEPFYSVRFNSPEHVKERNVAVGMLVYCAPNSEHTNYVFVDELMKVKGTDTPWEDNDEAPVELLDFSDDESEQIAKRTALRSSNSRNQGNASFDSDQPPRKRVNSFERRMNERNLQKSALPPEPKNPFAGVARNTPSSRGKRSTGFTGQQRGVRFNHNPAFPSPYASSQPMGAYQPRPTQHAWDVVTTMPGQVSDHMGYMHSSMTSQPLRPPGVGGPFQPRNRPYAQGRGYGFGPFPSSRAFPVANVQTPPPMRYPTNSQPVGPPMALAYSMGSPMQPNPGSTGYPTGFMQHTSQQSPYPVLLRPATFQGGPPRYDTGYTQSMPFGSRPPAFPPGCYPARPGAGPPLPPMRGQPYNPMFSGMALFNPGFPPPQLPPRGNMYPVGPPPPPRGGV